MKFNRKNSIHIAYITMMIGMLILISLSEAVAQKRVPCNRSLAAANKEYETGKFAAAVKMLSSCLNTFSKQEKIEAYRLLAMCQLALNNEEKAIESAQKLLFLKTDYREFPYFDPIEFTKLLSKFEIWPKLEMGFKTGFNINTVGTGKNYSVSGANQTYAVDLGYQAGIVGEYFFKQQLSLNAELLFEGLSYTMDAIPISNWKQHYNEKLNYLTIPISGKYYFFKHKDLLLAAEVGFQTQLLLTTTSNFTYENQVTGFVNQNSLELTENRKSMLFYGLVGLSMKQKLGMGMFTANIRYAAGINNIVNETNRYDDINYILTYQHVDSDIRFNPLYISIGYQFPINGVYAVKIRK